jgi:hypothetical protein
VSDDRGVRALRLSAQGLPLAAAPSRNRALLETKDTRRSTRIARCSNRNARRSLAASTLRSLRTGARMAVAVRRRMPRRQRFKPSRRPPFVLPPKEPTGDEVDSRPENQPEAASSTASKTGASSDPTEPGARDVR